MPDDFVAGDGVAPARVRQGAIFRFCVAFCRILARWGCFNLAFRFLVLLKTKADLGLNGNLAAGPRRVAADAWCPARLADIFGFQRTGQRSTRYKPSMEGTRIRLVDWVGRLFSWGKGEGEMRDQEPAKAGARAAALDTKGPQVVETK